MKSCHFTIEELEIMSTSSFQNIKKQIKKSSIQEFENWFLLYQKIYLEFYHQEIFNRLNTHFQDIPYIQEKLDCVLSHSKSVWEKADPLLLRSACFNLHENIAEQLLKRNWDPNKSYEDFCLHSPLAAVLFPKEKIKEKQNHILKLLIQHGLSLELSKEDKNKDSIDKLIKKRKHYHIYDWIKSFREYFNDTQRKEWDTFLSQHLF